MEAAKAYSAATGVPIATFVIGPDRDLSDTFGDWAAMREIDEAGCVLVRPDHHVAFRARSPVADAGATLTAAMNRLLGTAR